jgi:hypothetical protein
LSDFTLSPGIVTLVHGDKITDASPSNDLTVKDVTFASLIVVHLLEQPHQLILLIVTGTAVIIIF